MRCTVQRALAVALVTTATFASCSPSGRQLGKDDDGGWRQMALEQSSTIKKLEAENKALRARCGAPATAVSGAPAPETTPPSQTAAPSSSPQRENEIRIVAISARLVEQNASSDRIAWQLSVWNTGAAAAQVRATISFLDDGGFALNKLAPRELMLMPKKVETVTDTFPVARSRCTKVRVDLETPWGPMSSEDIVDRLALAAAGSSAVGGGSLRSAWGPTITAFDPYQIVVEGTVVNDGATEVITSATLRVLEDSGRTLGEKILSFRLQPGQRQEYRQVFPNGSRSEKFTAELEL